ncbi:paramyosin [Thalictrum thalictroides]|uniref:Paramyosin n=1 Tax=Thalictrum thalictroides TaxID=46969 RepID=A0A7J6WV30_THATH|nr:paramyosin [Thalictrum thalictroides]
MSMDESNSVLVDIDEEEIKSFERYQEELVAELKREREARETLEASINQLKLFAQETLKEKQGALKQRDEIASKIRVNESKLDVQRSIFIKQFSYIAKIHELLYSVINVVDGNVLDESDLSSNSLFVPEEFDMEENLRDSLAGLESIYESTKITMGKVRDEMEKRSREAKGLNIMVDQLMNEKQNVGVLLRSALQEKHTMESLSKMSELVRVAEDGFREKGVDNSCFREKEEVVEDVEQDKVTTLADALENIVGASQLEISKLKQSVDELRGESRLLKAQVKAQAKDLSQSERCIEEVTEKERLANTNVEVLKMEITAAKEEVMRSKMAVEQEAAVSRAVGEDLIAQLSYLRQELDQTKEVILELETKLRLKENVATAAMGVKDASEKSLRLADLRNSKQREWLEDLSRQLESVMQKDLQNQNKQRYSCWPWQWRGLNFVGYHLSNIQQQNATHTELSEPLI